MTQAIKMADHTNRYRRADHRAAYERALELARQDANPSYFAIALALDRRIVRGKRQQIAAKAVRVARHRRR
jgi:hypothetical protein